MSYSFSFKKASCFAILGLALPSLGGIHPSTAAQQHLGVLLTEATKEGDLLFDKPFHHNKILNFDQGPSYVALEMDFNPTTPYNPLHLELGAAPKLMRDIKQELMVRAGILEEPADAKRAATLKAIEEHPDLLTSLPEIAKTRFSYYLVDAVKEHSTDKKLMSYLQNTEFLLEAAYNLTVHGGTFKLMMFNTLREETDKPEKKRSKMMDKVPSSAGELLNKFQLWINSTLVDEMQASLKRKTEKMKKLPDSIQDLFV